MTLRVLYFGTYDRHRARNRMLISALRRAGADVRECHVDVWSGVADKVQVRGIARLRYLLRWAVAYPRLIRRYLAAPEHDVVVIGYMGHFDVLLLSWLVRRRRIPLVWDAFLSLYDTVVCDRRLLAARHPVARFLKSIEAAACRRSDRVVLDTAAHASLFRDLYHLPQDQLAVIFVGADEAGFPRAPVRARRPGEPLRVLFYGHFIPLHGTETIAEAIRLARDLPIEWTLIGQGQDAPATRRILERDPPVSVNWIPRVPYEELIRHIADADVCLGIFGRSSKAARVIPHKVFEVLSAGRSVVTRDSPAIRELLTPGVRGIRLVSAGDPAALLEAVVDLGRNPEAPPIELRDRFAEPMLGRHFLGILEDAVARQSER